MKIYIIATIIVVILFLQSIVFGVNDLWVMYSFIITSGFIWISVDDLHSGNRQMLRVKAKENSRLYIFLSKKRNPVMMLFALLSSVILSCIMLVMIKGLIQQHGIMTVIVVLFIVSLLLSNFISRLNPKYEKLINDNIDEDIAEPGVELLTVYYGVIMINVALALFFSAYDTYQFKTSDIDLINFSEKVLQVSIAKNDYNNYSRILINFYVLIDHIKIALAKHMVSIFDFGNDFYGLYVIFVTLNGFKFFGLSIAFVLLHRAIYRVAHFSSLPFINKKRI